MIHFNEIVDECVSILNEEMFADSEWDLCVLMTQKRTIKAHAVKKGD